MLEHRERDTQGTLDAQDLLGHKAPVASLRVSACQQVRVGVSNHTRHMVLAVHTLGLHRMLGVDFEVRNLYKMIAVRSSGMRSNSMLHLQCIHYDVYRHLKLVTY